MNKEEMYQGLRDAGYTEKQIEKLLVSELTEEQYGQLIEAKAEKVNIDKKSGNLKFTKVNHSKRAEKFGRISDGDTTAYLNIALEYFEHRCALSGEKFESFGNVKDSKAKSNLSAEHVVALCQGGDDVYPNLVPTVLQYNISKNGYYLLDWWNKQKNSDETQTLYSPYRLLKLVNYMMKSLDARNQNLSIKEYEKAILTPNEIDEFLDGIEQQDRQEKDNSKRKSISDVVTTVEIDEEDEKKILQTIPEMEGNIPKQSEQQREKEDDTMMDIFLYDSIKMLKEDEQLIGYEEFEQLVNCLDEMYEKAIGVIPFEIEVRNILLDKLEKLGVEENKYTVANELLQNTEILKITRENKERIEEYLSQYFEEKEKQLIEELKLTKEQIQTAITNVPSIFYDKSVIKKIKFYKEYRPNHLKDYLEGNNNTTDEFIDDLIILQNIGVDTYQLKGDDTIESLAKKSGISVEQIKEAGLKPNDKIGNRKKTAFRGYRGKGDCIPPTEEQVEELRELGISLSLEEIDRIDIQEFIDRIKLLKNIGVDTYQLKGDDTIESLAKKSNISRKQLEDEGLNPNENIGRKKDRIIQAYRGNNKCIRPTEEQVKELRKLGISFEKGEIQKFIYEIKLLQNIRVDTNELERGDTIESLAEKSNISRKQLEDEGLNPSEKIGQKKANIEYAYRWPEKRTPPTNEQVEELKNLGIFLEKKDTSKKIQSVVVEQKKAGKIGDNREIDEIFKEDFKHAEHSKEQESGDR